ncbi:MAG: hypothetical protein SGBAC_013585 [Bacillariaceae sp.]
MNDNDVLSHRGKGAHPGNCNLRKTIQAKFVDYDTANNLRKREIAKGVVLNIGGRFMGWDEDNRRYFEMTNGEAVKLVRKAFDRLRHQRKKQTNQTEPQLNQEAVVPDGTGSGAVIDAVIDAEEIPPAEETPTGNDFVSKDLFNAGGRLSDIDELGSGMGSISLDSLQRMCVDLFDPSEEHTVVSSNVLRDEDDNSARGRLMALLSEEGGEQLAQTLLSIVDLADQEAAAAPGALIMEDSQRRETLLKAKDSLQRQWRNSKRVRRNAPEASKRDEGNQPGAVGKAGGAKDDKSKSIHSSQSVIPFETEQDMPRLQIVQKLKIGTKNDREYTGSTMKGKPHGMGFMVYNHGRILCGNWCVFPIVSSFELRTLKNTHSIPSSFLRLRLLGIFQGQGCAIYENGDKCFGSFCKNKVHGFATYKTKFTKYVGQYDMNTRHGKGVFQDEERGTYNGDFVNGKFEGLGVHTAMNGVMTKGDFENWEIGNGDGSEAEDVEENMNT